jgi:hypothetical protein
LRSLFRRRQIERESVAILTCAIFGLIPSLRASRVDPVIALRHE